MTAKEQVVIDAAKAFCSSRRDGTRPTLLQPLESSVEALLAEGEQEVWTTTPPTEPGWYWIRMPKPVNEGGWHIPFAIEVEAYPDGELFFDLDDDCVPQDHFGSFSWHPTPIQPPKESQ